MTNKMIKMKIVNPLSRPVPEFLRHGKLDKFDGVGGLKMTWWSLYLTWHANKPLGWQLDGRTTKENETFHNPHWEGPFHEENLNQQPITVISDFFPFTPLFTKTDAVCEPSTSRKRSLKVRHINSRCEGGSFCEMGSSQQRCGLPKRSEQNFSFLFGMNHAIVGWRKQSLNYFRLGQCFRVSLAELCSGSGT